MKQKIKIRFLKSCEDYKKGEIFEVKKKEVSNLVRKGIVEYVKEEKKAVKPVKKKINKNSVNGNKNTTTPTLPTIHYYINSWGYFNKTKKILIEQITPNFFIYNIKGELGISEVKEIGEGNKKLKYLVIKDSTFFFKKTIYPAFQFYNVPSLNKVQKFIEQDGKGRDFYDIEKDIQNVLLQMFDFGGEIDVKTSSLAIGQSWIKPLLNEFFFFGIDATKGGGKTTLGEIVYFLMRHGFVGGNISSAAIPRLITELDLNIFVDEIDQNVKDEDTMAILRKGQRRGNPYVRCEGRDNRPVVYELAGCHGFSYRSEIEDAFMDRAIRTHTTKSMNYMLPVINSSKKEILKPLADELFLWYIKNLFVVGCSEERGVAVNSKPTTIYSKNLFNRAELYNSLVKNFTKEEKSFLEEVFGRDNELTFLCFKTAKILGFEMLEDIKKIIKKKQSDEASSENFYLETLKNYIVSIYDKISQRKLKDGDNSGCSFYPKNKLYQGFVKYLKELKVESVGTKRNSSFLRDIGFVEGISLRSQKYENYPTSCLIFTDGILKTLGLNFPEIKEAPKKEEEAKEEKIEREVNVTEEQESQVKNVLGDFEE